MRPFLLLTIAALGLAGCAHGNVKPVADNTAPPPPKLHNPTYDPYAAYGSANAIWSPPAYDTDGTIVKPTSPSTQSGRPPYEAAPWAERAQGNTQDAPPGTF